ncbi:unnamed protein product, partial [Nesidiocoris tenuis]
MCNCPAHSPYLVASSLSIRRMAVPTSLASAVITASLEYFWEKDGQGAVDLTRNEVQCFGRGPNGLYCPH